MGLSRGCIRMTLVAITHACTGSSFAVNWNLEEAAEPWFKKKKQKKLPSVLQNCLLNLTLPRSLAHGEWKCLVYSCMESARLASLSPRRTVFTPVGCGGWWPLMAGDEPVGSSPCVFAQWLLSLSFLSCWRLNAANFLFEQFLSSSAPPSMPFLPPSSCLNLRVKEWGHWADVGLVWGHVPCEQCEVLLLNRDTVFLSPAPILRPFFACVHPAPPVT